MRFRTLADSDYEKILVGKGNSDPGFTYYPFIKITYLEQYVSEEEVKRIGKYAVTLGCVSIQKANKKAIEAFAQWGAFFSLADLSKKERRDVKLEVLISEGMFALVKQEMGNNLASLLKEVREEIPSLTFLFGFYMDRPQNMIGATGWDLMAGRYIPR